MRQNLGWKPFIGIGLLSLACRKEPVILSPKPLVEPVFPSTSSSSMVVPSRPSFYPEESLQEALSELRVIQRPLQQTQEDIQSESEKGMIGAEDFLFLLAQGSGLEGYRTLRVDAKGRADYVFDERTGVGKTINIR